MPEAATPFSFTCACCGKTMTDLPDVGFDSPIYYGQVPESEREARAELGSDFCVIDSEDYFVRTVCLLPIQGSDRSFGWGVWSSLSPENYQRYRAAYDDPGCSKLGGMFGWFSNRLPCYPDTLNLHCTVWPQDGNRRPYLIVNKADAGHPLYREQQEGLSLERLGEIYAEAMCESNRRG